jgi:hypothetical protein
MFHQPVILSLAALALLLAPPPHGALATTDRGPISAAIGKAANEQNTGRCGMSLVRAVLQTNGESEIERRRSEDAFLAFSRQLRESGKVAGTPRRQARAIHEFAHQHILRGKYETGGSDLAAALAGGPFNCATASVLFLALAADFGLDAHAVAVPGHVWCRVIASGPSFDVETTCRNWFELPVGERAASKETKQFMADHELRSAGARDLDQRALIAVFHYNQGVRLLNEQQFSAAAVANLRALAFDPRCRPAYDNLLATINNWSLALALQGNQPLGLNLLETGMVLAKDYEPFRVNYRFLSGQPGARD